MVWRDPVATPEAVDHDLKWAFAAWEGLLETEQEIDTWDLIDQIVYLEEWPIQEDRLRRLARYAETIEFSDEQQMRYSELLEVVKEHRPIIERLLRT